MLKTFSQNRKLFVFFEKCAQGGAHVGVNTLFTFAWMEKIKQSRAIESKLHTHTQSLSSLSLSLRLAPLFSLNTWLTVAFRCSYSKERTHNTGHWQISCSKLVHVYVCCFSMIYQQFSPYMYYFLNTKGRFQKRIWTQIFFCLNENVTFIHILTYIGHIQLFFL